MASIKNVNLTVHSGADRDSGFGRHVEARLQSEAILLWLDAATAATGKCDASHARQFPAEQRKQRNGGTVLGGMEQLAEDRQMSLFIAQWIARASVMVPVVIGVTAAAWVALSVAGVMKRGVPLDVADMRTWPLQFALGEAAIFAIIFSGIAAWAGDSPALVAAASGVAACLAVGVAHVLARRGKASG